MVAYACNLALWRLRQEDHKFKAGLGYKAETQAQKREGRRGGEGGGGEEKGEGGEERGQGKEEIFLT
jgi:hypothetical protein